MGFGPMMAVVGGMQLASGVVGYFGSKESAQAQAQAAEYNARVNSMNAAVAKENSAIASQAGEAHMGIVGMKGKANVGDILANQGASGIDPNTGSAVDVRKSAATLAQLDALTARSNAVKEAYGYDTQAVGFKAQAGLDKMQAKHDISAGNIAGYQSLLGGAAGAGNAYGQWRIASGPLDSGSGYKIENSSTNSGNDYYDRV